MNAGKRLLCFLLLLACLTVTAHAEGSSHITVSQAGGRRGDTVTIDVSLDRVNGIAGGSFNVVYDSGSLTLVGAEAGLGGGTINQHYAEDTVRISFAGTRPLQAPGSLLKLTFRVSDGAPLGLLPIRVAGQKFYNENAEPVSVEAVSGGVSVQAVEAALSSDRCLPGQAVKLELSLGGGLYPAGGEFDIVYNPRLLTAGSLNAEQKLGNTMINLSYSIDKEAGVIHAVWAAASPIGAHGRLCTAIFAVAESAAGETPVSIRNYRFFDENGSPMECLPPEDGMVTVVSQYKEQPTLYVVGGKLAEDGTATVQIAVDGAGVVCGGVFRLSYDTALCTLTAAVPKMACVAVNPEDTGSAGGIITASWAEDSPALDNETVLELTFRLKDASVPAELGLDQVALKDNAGRDVGNVRVDSGKIGISSSLQRPAAQLVQEDRSVGVQATLYDAEFCGGERTGAAQVILASYTDGKLSLLTLPPDAVSFDHNGIARVSANVRYDPSISHLQLFIVNDGEKMVPLCEKVEFSL